MPKAPQDHKKKTDVADAQHYAFTVVEDGKPKTYSLPPASIAADKLPGKFLRDAYMDGDNGEMRLGFASLEVVGADPEAIEALYSLPSSEMIDRMAEWMQHKSSEEDASLGESDSSSS